MRNIELPPEKLLLTDHVDEGTVAIYLSLLVRNFKKAVGRVIASPTNQEDFECDDNYLIIEGNNRAVAYALIGNSIPVIEVVNDSDIGKCRKKAEEGKISRFAHPKGNYRSILTDGIARNARFSMPKTLDQYVKTVIQNRQIEVDKLPHYIREKIIERN